MTPADLANVGEGLIGPRRAAAAVLGPKTALRAGETFERSLFG